MKAPKIIFFLLLVGVFSFLVLNHLGYLYLLNPYLNRLFPPKIDTYCQSDEDCILALPTESLNCGCPSCKNYKASNSEVIAINKNWKPRCLFRTPRNIVCLACITIIDPEDYRTVCQDKKCHKLKD